MCCRRSCSAPLDAYAAMLERLARCERTGPTRCSACTSKARSSAARPVHIPSSSSARSISSGCARSAIASATSIRLVTLAPEADPDLRGDRTADRARHRRLARALDRRLRRRAARRPTPARTSSRISSTAWVRCTTVRPGSPAPRSTDERLVPSLIADLVHVHPAMVHLALAARRRGARLRRGTRSRHHTRRRHVGRIEHHDDHAVRNVASLASHTRHGSLPTGNPARVLGLTDRGRIAPGTRADLVALDPETLAVRSVWSSGHEVAKG